ncbi:MAG: DUF393 domain-containing protein [Leptospiraceae bacterium]|nr:DUF393 domain-containing protein [Leptospiraceae bacterium]
MSNIFFYDGDCKFCKSLVEKLKNLYSKENLEFKSFRDLSEDELLKIHPELYIGKLESEVQLIWNSKRYPGFFAVRKIFPGLKYYKFLTPLLYIPLIPHIGMFIMFYLKGRKDSIPNK